MTEATEFIVTVPGLYLRRDGEEQRILWVGMKGNEVLAVGYDVDGGLTDWGEDGAWRHDLDERRADDEDLVELIEADAPPAPVSTQQPSATEEPIELRRARAAHDLLTLYDYSKYHAEQALTHVRALRLDS